MKDEDPQCGRPAGMRLRGKYLYVADLYYGIVKIDIINGNKKIETIYWKIIIKVERKIV